MNRTLYSQIKSLFVLFACFLFFSRCGLLSANQAIYTLLFCIRLMPRIRLKGQSGTVSKLGSTSQLHTLLFFVSIFFVLSRRCIPRSFSHWGSAPRSRGSILHTALLDAFQVSCGSPGDLLSPLFSPLSSAFFPHWNSCPAASPWSQSFYLNMVMAPKAAFPGSFHCILSHSFISILKISTIILLFQESGIWTFSVIELYHFSKIGAHHLMLSM